MSLALVLPALLVAGVVAAPPAAAAAQLTLTKNAPASVLAGEEVTYTLTARNPGDAPLYNISFRDLLPRGVRLVAGSTEPAQFGQPAPTTVTIATTGEQTVIWGNVTDLQPGSSATLTFRATVDTANVWLVGSSFVNNGSVYGSTDARQVPKFTPGGVPIDSPAVLDATASGSPTLVTPIKVTKSEPSPEGELLRGVHKQVTTYTLTVTNNKGHATTDTVLVDFVPASLEFLGCSGVDNTRVDPATGNPTEEYPGSGPLGLVPAPADCVFPTSVSTVTNPTVGGATLTGVYTRLEWNNLGTLGDFAPNQAVTVRYAAGVPLRANTTNWSARPGGAPSAVSGLQASNLDNNTGASTQETTSEQTATNTARIEGNYDGPFAPGSENPVFDQTTATVRLEDVSLQKSVDTPTFAATQIATFTLRVRVSEYVNSTEIRLTDLLPNGYCPLSSTTNHVTGAPLDCAPIPTTDPTGATYASVTQLTSGEFSIVFSDLSVDANGTATVVFRARMREFFTGGSLAGTPTTSGDSFTNRVTLTANTTAIPGTNEPPGQVLDESEATQTTEGLTLNKRVQPRVVPQDCVDVQGSNPYVDSDQIAAPGFDTSRVAFRKGDRVCFQLDVTFPRTTASRNVVITDIIPEGTAYEALSQDVDGIDPSGVTFNEAASVAGSAFPTWQLRSSPGSNSVLAGTIVRIRFSVLVTEAAPPGSVDITGNLMKMSTQSSSGQVRSYRDEVPFGIIPAPPVPLVKGIAAINGAPVNAPPAEIDPPTTGVDGEQVVEGDVVTFRVDITNGGNATDLNAFSIRGLQVWDVLPAGIRCAQISNIGPVSAAPGAPDGVCTDPSDDGHPTFTERAQLSAIVWTFRTGVDGDADLILSGDTRTLTYDMAIPTPSSISGRYDNTAHVRSFDAFSNRFGTVAEYYPSDNVDTTVDAADYSGPPSRDVSDVRLPNAAFSKVLVSTGLNEQNNPTPPNPPTTPPTGNVAVNGEAVSYRIRLDVPARTSVFNGQVSDPLPTSLVRDSSSFAFYPDAASSTPGTPPLGVTFNATTGALLLNSTGSTYTNSTDTVQRFEVTVQGRVSPMTSAGGKTNTATFRRTATIANVAPIDLPAAASVTVRIPNPSLTKDNDAGGEVRAGETVEYTLRATNRTGTPPLHDTVVYDCVPAGLTFLSYGILTQGSTATDIPGDGVRCPTTSRQLQWNVGTILGGTTTPNAPDSGESLTYTVEVDPSAAGAATYTNTVAMTGSTLPNGANDPAVERVIGRDAFDEVRVATGAVIKTANPDRATVGQQVEFSVSATVPRSVNFYAAALLDSLPPGIDAGSVAFVSAECSVVGPPTETCSPGPATPLSPQPLPGGSTRIGWYAGDLLAHPNVRIITIRYTAVVADSPGPSPVRGDEVTNTATSAWFLTDDPNRPMPGAGTTFDRYGSQDSATVTVLEPQVALAKSVSDATPEPGDLFTYSVDITNGSSALAANNSTAYDLVVVDSIPNGVVVIEPVAEGSFAADADPSDGGGTITWTFESLAAGATVSRSYDARLAGSPFLDGTALTNTVRATEYRSLDGAGRAYTCPSCATATATVTPDLPELSVTKTAVGGAPAYIDESYPWRITVTNTGAGAADHVVVSDALPPNWRYAPGTSVVTRPDGTSLPQALSDSVLTGDVQSLAWGTSAAPLVDLAPGQTVTIDFEATPNPFVVANPTVGASVPHVNTASAIALDGAGFPGYNTPEIPYAATDAAQTRIDSADLFITKSHSTPTEPAAGAPFDWLIDVRNDGTDTAVGVFTVSDDLPTGVIPNGVPSGEGWSCAAPDADGAFTCQRVDPSEVLASGASFPRITVPVTTDPSTSDGTTYANTAAIQGRTYDPNEANNKSTDPVVLRTEADVAVTKTLTDAPIVAGEDATYIVDVVNDGPSTALGTITVTDTLPPGSILQAADGGADWECPVPTATPGVLTCTYEGNSGDLLPGTTNQITVVVEVPSGQTADVINKVVVDSPVTPDPDLDNNEDSVTTRPGTSADLAITKVSVPQDEELVAGAPGTYRLTVVNIGPSDANDVSISDPLPAGLTYTGFTAVDGDWSCSADTEEVVTCDLDNDPLAAGETVVVEIEVAIAPDVSGPIVNTATVSSTTDDPDPENNSSSDRSGSRAEADVFITKTDSPDPVIAGERLTYTLTVGNDGPSDAQGPIEITDPLPAGTSFVSVTPDVSGSPWSCSEDSGEVSCTRSATLRAGDDGTGDRITIVVDVDPSAGPGSLSNTATVESRTTPEVDEGNNSATATTEVIDRAEISLTKATTGATTITAGSTTGTAFTLTVTNDGPSSADGLVVTDVLPTGLIPVSASGAGWTCDDPIVGQTITCTRAALPPGTSTITVTARASASVLDGTTLTNEASVTTTTPGDDPDNNRGTAPVDVAARADLTLTKTHPAGTALAGDAITFTLTGTNNGPSDAQPVLTIEDTLPVGLVFLTGAAPWECTADPPTDNGQVVTCTLTGANPLPPMSDAPALELTARIAPSADPGEYLNTATIASPTSDPDPDNNGASDPVEVGTEADLAIAKSHTGPVRIGDDLAFTITVTNNGPSDARAVTVTDVLPEGLTYVSSSVQDPPGSCSESAGTVECLLDDPLPPLGTATLLVTTTVGVAAYPSVTNPATVSSTTPDTDDSNNNASDPVLVPPLVDLQIAKSHTDAFVVGQQADYLLTVRNEGPTEDPGPITIVDQIPSGLTFVSAVGQGWTCEAESQTVTCTLADGLEMDDEGEVTLTVLVGPAAVPGVVNTASVASGSEDRDPANNTAIDPTDITPLSELAVAKEVVSQEGSQVLFLLTATNLGPNATSTALVLTDALPPELTLVSVNGAGWQCSNVAPTVTCLHEGVLAVDESSAVTLTVEVNAEPEQEITNVATLAGGSATAGSVTDSASFTTPPDADTGGTGDNDGDPGLAETGSRVGSVGLLALAMLVLGGAAVLSSRARRQP